MARTLTPPDLDKIKEVRYLSLRQIRELCHVGDERAARIAEACAQETKRNGFEILTGKTYYKRILAFLGEEE